jgi:hypothetical protein
MDISKYIPNPKFVNTLHRLFIDEPYTDIIYDSYEPQNGKTKVLLISSWLDYYINGRVSIVILDNRYNDLRQLIDRIDSFNTTTSYHLVLNRNIYLFLNNEYRLIQVINLIRCLTSDKTIIIDESDRNVGSCMPTTKKVRENITREILTLLTPRDRVIYISATSFAVINSPHRNQRNIKYIHIPDNLYDGLEYRGLVHPKLEIITTNCLKHIYNLIHLGFGYDDSYIHEFFHYYHDFVNNQVCNEQPNICLFNVFDKNIDKHRIRRFITSNFDNTKTTFVIYTGNGITEITKDGMNNYDIYIGEYLQLYKDNGKKDPIIIFATRMASRSQTFRPRDNTWKLTHMFLYHNPKSNWEYRLQSLRCNGQYRPQDPPTKLYISTIDYHTLLLIRHNKKDMSKRLEMYKNIKPRDIWINTPMLLIRRDNITRKENQDFRMVRSRNMIYGLDDINFECTEYFIYR